MYQITIRINKHAVEGVQTSNENLETIYTEAISIMDKPISFCSNSSFDAITFNNVESNDTAMLDGIVSTYGVTVSANEIIGE